jgi:hypothetical protein
LNGKKVMDDKLERREGTGLGILEVLAQHLPWETEEIHEIFGHRSLE